MAPEPLAQPAAAPCPQGARSKTTCSSKEESLQVSLKGVGEDGEGTGAGDVVTEGD